MVEIKGSAVIGTIERLKEEFGAEAHFRVVQNLPDGDRKLFQGALLSSSWYPLDAFVSYIATENNLLYHGDLSVILSNSEKIVDRQLQGVYKLFTKENTPEFVVNRIGVIHSSYFRGIGLQVVTSASGEYVGRYSGFEKNHQIFEYSICAFYRKALEMSGARDVEANFTVPFGSPVGYSEIRVTWNPPATAVH